MITKIQPFTANQRQKSVSFGNAESFLTEFIKKGKTQELVNKFAQEITAARIINNTEGTGEIFAQMCSVEGGSPYMDRTRTSDAQLAEILLSDVKQKIINNPLLDDATRLEKLKNLFSIYCVPKLNS